MAFQASGEAPATHPIQNEKKITMRKTALNLCCICALMLCACAKEEVTQPPPPPPQDAARHATSNAR